MLPLSGMYVPANRGNSAIMSSASVINALPLGVPVHRYTYAGRVLCWVPTTENTFATKDDSLVTCPSCLEGMKHLVKAA